MILIWIITLILGFLPADVIAEQLVMPIGGAPINVLDFGLLLASIYSLLAQTPEKWKPAAVHPVLKLALVLYCAGLIAGTVAWSVRADISMIWFLRCFRHYLTLPLTAAIGYAIVRTPRAFSSYVVVTLIAAAGTALSIVLFFNGHAQSASDVRDLNVNMLRTVAYNTSYAGITVALLLFLRFEKVNFLWRGVAKPLAVLCGAGALATLTRSDWLSTLSGCMPVFLVASPGMRLRRIIQTVLILPVAALIILMLVVLAGYVMGRDFSAKIEKRVESILPMERQGRNDDRAWDSRLPGIEAEMSLWERNPLIGSGFGSQYALFFRLEGRVSMRHCVFTSILAEAGILGLLPVLLMLGSMIVIGRRMVRERFDTTSFIAGGLGLIMACHMIVKGICTQSWNNQREGILLGLTFGVLLRARAIQLRMMQQQADESEAPAYSYDDEFSTPLAIDL